MGSNPMTSVLIRRREELDRERGRQRLGRGGGGFSPKSRMPGATRNWEKQRRTLPQGPRRNPRDMLKLDLWPPESERVSS